MNHTLDCSCEECSTWPVSVSPHANHNNNNSSQSNNCIDVFEDINEFNILFNLFDVNQTFDLSPNPASSVESATSSCPPSVSSPQSVSPPSVSMSPPSVSMSPPSKRKKPEKGTPEYEIQHKKSKEAAARHIKKRKEEKIEKEKLFAAIQAENRELNWKLVRAKQIYNILDQYLISIDYSVL